MLRAAAVLAVGVLCPCLATAQPVERSAPRLEVWGAVSFFPNGPSATLTPSYSPPLLFDGEYTSSAVQSINVDGGLEIGFEVGANVFVTRRLGLQAFLHRASSDIASPSTPYNVDLQYTSRQPPDGQAQLVQIHQSTPWPTTTASLTELTMGVNGVLRIGLSGTGQVGRDGQVASQRARVGGTVSAGVSFNRIGGTVQPLGFTTFRLGGHSVLFQDDHRLEVSLEPAGSVGFNVGGDVDIAVGRYAAVVVGYRYVGSPDIEVQMRPKTVLNADQIVFQETIAEITQQYAVAPVRIGVSGSRIVAGLKFRR